VYVEERSSRGLNEEDCGELSTDMIIGALEEEGVVAIEGCVMERVGGMVAREEDIEVEEEVVAVDVEGTVESVNVDG